MAKAALICATIFLLAFSGGLTSTHTNQVVFSQNRIASPAIASSSQAADDVGAAMLLAPSGPGGVGVTPAADDAPAPALLVYLALILIGSAIAVGLLWRSYRRQI